MISLHTVFSFFLFLSHSLAFFARCLSYSLFFPFLLRPSHSHLDRCCYLFCLVFIHPNIDLCNKRKMVSSLLLSILCNKTQFSSSKRQGPFVEYDFWSRDFDIHTRLEAAKRCKWFLWFLVSCSLLLLFCHFERVSIEWKATYALSPAIDRCFRACADNHQLLNYIYMDHLIFQFRCCHFFFSMRIQFHVSSLWVQQMQSICFIFFLENCHRNEKLVIVRFDWCFVIGRGLFI